MSAVAVEWAERRLPAPDLNRLLHLLFAEDAPEGDPGEPPVPSPDRPALRQVTA